MFDEIQPYETWLQYLYRRKRQMERDRQNAANEQLDKEWRKRFGESGAKALRKAAGL